MSSSRSTTGRWAVASPAHSRREVNHARSFSLPAPILAELRAANARRGVDFDGPHGRQFQLWATASGAVVMAELHPDGSVFLWRPLEQTNSMAATVDALRAYLANPT